MAWRTQFGNLHISSLCDGSRAPKGVFPQSKGKGKDKDQDKDEFKDEHFI